MQYRTLAGKVFRSLSHPAEAPRHEFEVVNREIRIEYGGGFMIERCGLVIGVDDKATTNSLNRHPERIKRKVTRDIQPGVYVWYELINREGP